MLNKIGWIGSLLMSFCGLPEVWKSYMESSCSIGWGMLLSWGIGEILLFIYVAPKKDYPLLVNYVINILCVGILIYYKAFV